MKTWNHRVVGKVQSRVGGLFCLLTLLCGQVQLMPSLLALGAMLDASHQVSVSLDEGKFTLALHHERAQPGRADYEPQRDPSHASHKHGLVAGCVCALSSSNDQTPDHVACFASGLASEQSLSAAAPKARSRDLFGHLDADVLSVAGNAVSPKLPQREAHAPPISSVLQSLRSVTLLI